MAGIKDVIDRLRVLDSLFNDQSNEKGKIFIKYYTCEQDQQTYLCISRPSVQVVLIERDGAALNKEKLLSLKTEQDLLYKEDRPKETDVFAIWDKMYWTFIDPLIELIPVNFCGYIFVLFEDMIGAPGNGPFINIQHIYDLSFFYSDNPDLSRLIFVNVSDPEPIRFLRKLLSAPLPLTQAMDILYGFPNDGDTPAGSFREKAFKEGMHAAECQGARIHTLGEIDLFEKIFSHENNGRVIQILTHFHNGKIFTPELKYIRVMDLVKLIDRMFIEDRLRSDICIHAATCNNFSFFKELYKSGIKNIYYSSNELLTSEIAAMFWELYHGLNAKKIKLSFPYLDGRSFVFEAWTKVSRCFYRNDFLENEIEII